MPRRISTKRLVSSLVLLIVIAIGSIGAVPYSTPKNDADTSNLQTVPATDAGTSLKNLEIKGRAAKTGYTRSQFGDGWARSNGCDTRNRILARDLTNITYAPTIDAVVCIVQSGTLADPYTGTTISFVRGEQTSDDVQIDHVVALSDAWQKGAQELTPDQRVAFANDPENLLAVGGNANQAKSDGDAATWLPKNTTYRCTYVTKQINVKTKYKLWITRAEYDAMNNVLSKCS